MATGFLGNYIHYRAVNYLKYGTTMSQKSMGRALNLEKVLEDKHSAIQAQFQAQKDDKFKEEYQATLNYLFGKEGQLNKNVEDQDLLEKEFTNLVKEKFPNIIIDYATLDSSIGNGTNLRTININKRISQGRHRLSFQAIESQLKQLQLILQTQQLQTSYTNAELKQHNAILNKLIAAEATMQEMAKKNLRSSHAFIKMSKNKNDKIGIGLDLRKLNVKQKSFISDLNYLIRLYNTVNKSLVQGELGELSAAFVGAKLQGVGANELKNFIEKSVVGKKDKMSSGYWQADFSSAFVDLAKLGESKGWEYHNENGGYVKATMPTQNKIDVQIETPEGMKTISVKNYNLKKRSSISAMTGVSFLTLIQNENQEDFMNHYFNITAEHPMEGDTIEPLLKIRDRMHNLIKQIILINALTGLNISKTALGGVKEQQGIANYFVINDSSKPGKFKIFTMSELLSLTTGEQAGFSKFVKVSGYNNPEWDNTWAESGPQERITKILMQAHQMKLHVGIAASVFK